MKTNTFIIGKDVLPEHIRLGAGESLNANLVVFPGTSADVNCTISLEGEDASVELYGLFVLRGKDTVHLNINVEHNAEGGTSRQVFKGTADDSSAASFNGLVKVAQGARRTDASQLCNSILMSRKASVTAQPQLEIYNDDVICSHGATTGFLSTEELYYLTSRGIPESEARKLLLQSFLSPVVERLDEAFKEKVLSLL